MNYAGFRPFVTLLIILASLLAGLALGCVLTTAINSYNRMATKDEQVKETDLVLQAMGSLAVGDTLADHVFEDLEGRPVRLSEIVLGNTWISIIEPTCESCVEDIRQLKQTLPDTSAARLFVFISASNPRYLRDLKDEIVIESAFLYDHRRTWSNRYDFYTYPFHIKIGRNLKVLEIAAGPLSREQIDETIGS